MEPCQEREVSIPNNTYTKKWSACCSEGVKVGKNLPPSEAWILSTELPPGDPIALVPLSLLLEATSTISVEMIFQNIFLGWFFRTSFLGWAEISLPMASTPWSQLYLLELHTACLLLCSLKAFQRSEDPDLVHFSFHFFRLIIISFITNKGNTCSGSNPGPDQHFSLDSISLSYNYYLVVWPCLLSCNLQFVWSSGDEIQKLQSQSVRLELESKLCHFLAERPWASCFNPLSFSFHICKICWCYLLVEETVNYPPNIFSDYIVVEILVGR